MTFEEELAAAEQRGFELGVVTGVYAFAAMVTTQKTAIIGGADHHCGPWAEAASGFVQGQQLQTVEPRFDRMRTEPARC